MKSLDENIILRLFYLVQHFTTLRHNWLALYYVSDMLTKSPSAQAISTVFTPTTRPKPKI